jgi:predicted deacetylase
MAELRGQILEGRQGLADCGIPLRSIVGFRAPYLASSPDVRMVLDNNGFLYDRWEQQRRGSGRCAQGKPEAGVTPSAAA